MQKRLVVHLNIARVIADTTGKPTHKIEEDMYNRKTLNPIAAKDFGLVHEIKSELFPAGADLTVIGAFVPNQIGNNLQFHMETQPGQ